MPATKTRHTPGTSDAAVKAKTGKSWAGWFKILDAAGAKKLPHAKIATLLNKEHQVPGWWSQMITVEYELVRGLRERHQKADGFSVSVSKTIATSLADLYAATASADKRKQWFPKGAFKPSSQTKNKYLNGAWQAGARLTIGFYGKGEDKSQIAIQVSKLAAKSDVEAERTAWKGALQKLKVLLEQ